MQKVCSLFLVTSVNKSFLLSEIQLAHVRTQYAGRVRKSHGNDYGRQRVITEPLGRGLIHPLMGVQYTGQTVCVFLNV